MKKEFLIEDGTLLKYEGKSKDILIPDEVTVINSYAIENVERVVLNSNCKKLCKWAIRGDIHEIVIPEDSKLSIIEERAIQDTPRTKPVVLPDNIKVLNEGMPPLRNLPKKLQSIKKRAFSMFKELTKDVIYFMPETLNKIEDGLNIAGNIFLTKNHQKPEGWNIPNYEKDCIVYNVIDEAIYEEDGYKYVICEDKDGEYSAIVAVPHKSLLIIPEKLGGKTVKVVCFVPKVFGNDPVMPALYISKNVIQLSYLHKRPMLIGDTFSKEISANHDFIELKEKGIVIEGIKKDDLKFADDFYYLDKPEGISVLRYVGDKTSTIVIPEEIDGKTIVSVNPRAFQFITERINFIRFPLSCEQPDHLVLSQFYHHPDFANKYHLFSLDIFNVFNESLEIMDYVVQDGFGMVHIKDIDEEGYVIVALDKDFKMKQTMNPPTKINGLKVLGIFSGLLHSYYMNSEVAKRYYSIYKKLY